MVDSERQCRSSVRANLEQQRSAQPGVNKSRTRRYPKSTCAQETRATIESSSSPTRFQGLRNHGPADQHSINNTPTAPALTKDIPMITPHRQSWHDLDQIAPTAGVALRAVENWMGHATQPDTSQGSQAVFFLCVRALAVRRLRAGFFFLVL